MSLEHSPFLHGILRLTETGQELTLDFQKNASREKHVSITLEGFTWEGVLKLVPREGEPDLALVLETSLRLTPRLPPEEKQPAPVPDSERLAQERIGEQILASQRPPTPDEESKMNAGYRSFEPPPEPVKPAEPALPAKSGPFEEPVKDDQPAAKSGPFEEKEPEKLEKEPEKLEKEPEKESLSSGKKGKK